jgi:hypothetical protein
VRRLSAEESPNFTSQLCSFGTRDVLFLDVALDGAIRQALETNFTGHPSGDVQQLSAITAIGLRNAALSMPGDAELNICSNALQVTPLGSLLPDIHSQLPAPAVLPAQFARDTMQLH